MIQDIFLRWIVTALFILHATECLFAIVRGRRTWTHVVNHLLHLAMSVAMVAMAWPKSATLPTAPPIMFFLLGAVWFLAIGFRGVGHRVVNGYHALIMLAMACMYAVTDGNLPPAQAGTAHHAHDMSSRYTSMPGMNMSDMGMPAVDTSSSTGGYPAWIDAINWACTIGFAIAALSWLYRYLALRKAQPTQPWHRFFGAARQAMMATGMATMFGMML